MDDLHSTLAAQDAADALIKLGWVVLPPTRSRPQWQVFDELLTTTELLMMASFVVIFPQARRSRR